MASSKSFLVVQSNRMGNLVIFVAGSSRNLYDCSVIFACRQIMFFVTIMTLLCSVFQSLIIGIVSQVQLTMDIDV